MLVDAHLHPWFHYHLAKGDTPMPCLALEIFIEIGTLCACQEYGLPHLHAQRHKGSPFGYRFSFSISGLVL
jgi:hypothetical protein